MGLDQLPEIFCCPICNSGKYEEVLGPMSMSNPIPEARYRCKGCSVIFADPEKFSAAAKKRCCKCQKE